MGKPTPEKHKRYTPITAQINKAILRAVTRDGMTYRDAVARLGVSMGAISKLVREFSDGKACSPKRRGRKPEDDTQLFIPVLIEIAKLSRFTPTELARLWQASPVFMQPTRTTRFESMVAQVRRILIREGLQAYCRRRKEPGTIAVHMAKVRWEDKESQEGTADGYLLMTMDLGTGCMDGIVVNRVLPSCILNSVNRFAESREHEYNRITFTTNIERQKGGKDVQVGCITRVSADDYVKRLYEELATEHRGRVEISYDPPTRRRRQHINIPGKYRSIDDLNATLRTEVDLFNKRILHDSESVS